MGQLCVAPAVDARVVVVAGPALLAGLEVAGTVVEARTVVVVVIGLFVVDGVEGRVVVDGVDGRAVVDGVEGRAATEELSDRAEVVAEAGRAVDEATLAAGGGATAAATGHVLRVTVLVAVAVTV